MKNYLLVFIVILFSFNTLPVQGSNQGPTEQISNYQVIPDEAIRLRILANSDQEDDQELKRIIRDQVNKEITTWVEDIDNITEARQVIQQRIGEIDSIVARTLAEQGIDQSFQVEYGKDVKFPTKIYGSYVYPSGSYEAILISLGEAKGANWWCVLFPPLCFLDFSNGTSVAEEEDGENDTEEVKQAENDEEDKEIKVKFFFMKWFI
ncbi:stage II sporulation protein R [Aquibacillus halophilus]|uniref:Stage II sporulation protein R n=1 Tax=Aquibacillus halophilus TaxID=930132 RepID=A0A6A8DE47_9BACI|nr:stage II sporulation protein R [Aquibacillus halophilus]MRH43978.1 stage II sporulation protein R [Aquibacillus halophilus]